MSSSEPSASFLYHDCNVFFSLSLSLIHKDEAGLSGPSHSKVFSSYTVVCFLVFQGEINTLAGNRNSIRTREALMTNSKAFGQAPLEVGELTLHLWLFISCCRSHLSWLFAEMSTCNHLKGLLIGTTYSYFRVMVFEIDVLKKHEETLEQRFDASRSSNLV